MEELQCSILSKGSCVFCCPHGESHCFFWLQMWILSWSSRETSRFCKRNGRLNCCQLKVCISVHICNLSVISKLIWCMNFSFKKCIVSDSLMKNKNETIMLYMTTYMYQKLYHLMCDHFIGLMGPNTCVCYQCSGDTLGGKQNIVIIAYWKWKLR